MLVRNVIEVGAVGEADECGEYDGQVLKQLQEKCVSLHGFLAGNLHVMQSQIQDWREE